jgi:hypothetical protein
MRMRNVIITASAGLALVLAGTAAGASIASIPDSAGMIHACYQSPPPAGGANLQVIDTTSYFIAR